METLVGIEASYGQTDKSRSRESVAEGTMAFHFEKSRIRPGQYVDVTLLNPAETDSEGDIRSFSIASVPFEDHITLATRMRDTAFKRLLKSVLLGVEAKLEGPGVLHSAQEAVKSSSVPAALVMWNRLRAGDSEWGQGLRHGRCASTSIVCSEQPFRQSLLTPPG